MSITRFACHALILFSCSIIGLQNYTSVIDFEFLSVLKFHFLFKNNLDIV